MDMTEAYPGRDSAPVKSEVLWGCPETSVNGRSRFTRENGWEWWTGREWAPHPQDATLVYQELARRLLAERAEQGRLDDHNDKLEAEAKLEASATWSVLNAHEDQIGQAALRIAELDQNLAREVERVTDAEGVARVRHRYLDQQIATLRSMVEAQENVLRRLDSDVALLRDAALSSPAGPPAGPPPPLSWDRTQGIMVDDNGKLALDLTEYFEDGGINEKEHDLLEKLAALWSAWGPEGYLRKRSLAALWSAWGPEGYLRKRLMEARYSGDDTSGSVLGWYRQLRSELLAKPWKEGV